jgi:hypothetical protein
MNATSESTWQRVALLYDEKAAHNLAALLEAEAVPTQVNSDSKLIGYALGWEICVPAAMVQRAHQLLAPSRFTDAELEYLATGVLAGDKEGMDYLDKLP